MILIRWCHYVLHLHKHHLSHLSLILILVNLELHSGDKVPVILANLQIIQLDIFRKYQSMFTNIMVIFLIPTETGLSGGYVVYGALIILGLTGYLYNYIGCFLC